VIQGPPSYGSGPPDVPPQTVRPRWNRRWWVIGLGALIVGIGIGGAAGASKTAPRAATVTAPAQTVVQTVPGPAKTTTVVHVRTVPGPAATVTQTVRASTPTPAAPSSGGGGGQSFSGNGGKNLGTITVANDSTLTWTNDGPLFTMLDDSGVPVNSVAHSGTSALSAGTYTNVSVNALGNWTIRSTSPRGKRPIADNNYTNECWGFILRCSATSATVRSSSAGFDGSTLQTLTRGTAGGPRRGARSSVAVALCDPGRIGSDA
jgi:hypothetical protein